MSILVGRKTRLLVQGITGRQAHMNTRYMDAYGTEVVAGVTPGKGGRKLDDKFPVYDSVKEAMRKHPDINMSVVYVPPRAVKSAVLEALDAGVPQILITTERVPQQDVMELIAVGRLSGSRIIGPNSIGVITPGECVVGLIGARVEMAQMCFRPGRIGVISRSGGQTATLSYYLTRSGWGQSTAVGIGGDAFVGTTAKDALAAFESDSGTDAVVYFGEVGTRIEEDAADLIRQKGFTKPFLAYVAGQFVCEGVRYGHAGALVSKGIGDVGAKRRLLKGCGAVVLNHLDDLDKELRGILK